MDNNFEQQIKKQIINNVVNTLVEKVKSKLTSLYKYEHSVYKAQTMRGNKDDKDASGVLPDDVPLFLQWSVEIKDSTISVSASIKDDFVKKLNDTQKSSLYIELQNAKKRFTWSW